MKAAFSDYLTGIAPAMKRFIERVGEEYPYVSVLSSDVRGFVARASQHEMSVTTKSMFTERGSVVRVWKDGLYSEYSFDEFDPDAWEKAAANVLAALSVQREMVLAGGTEIYETPMLPDEEEELLFEAECDSMPQDADLKGILTRLKAISDEGMTLSDEIIECFAAGQSVHVSKLFLTKNKDLRQSYVYTIGQVFADGTRNGRNESAHASFSGRTGVSLFERFPEILKEAADTLKDLLSAERIVPGEYDVITAPEVSGLIAHEAFGHGVEMDMFVKGRARGTDYIGKRVASDLVTMHEGAKAAMNVSSYAFDDEGTPAGDVIEIEKGILKNGICDALSALRLNVRPTGNGKRQSFAHKAYTRMTNTVFAGGDDTLEEMIASIGHGYLLRGMLSGMEDPKHWGIQCIVQRGYEIKDGKLTGKVVAPIVLTGYVPELLQSISMAGTDVRVDSGTCGKGYKEWVRVADGGPYLKARARLG